MSYQYSNSIIKIRQSHDQLIFRMKIPLPRNTVVMLRWGLDHLHNWNNVLFLNLFTAVRQPPGGRLNIKMSYQYSNSIIKIRESHDQLIFRMKIPLPRNTVVMLRWGLDHLHNWNNVIFLHLFTAVVLILGQVNGRTLLGSNAGILSLVKSLQLIDRCPIFWWVAMIWLNSLRPSDAYMRW